MVRSARRMVVAFAAVSLMAVAAVAAGPSALGATPRAGNDDLVHLNQIQVIGTHNSYHQLATDPERALRRSVLGDAEDEFEYYHRPLDVQFESEKVREIELDVFDDAKGGKYANPLIRQFVNGGPYDPAMAKPGIKVLHAQDVDYHSSCLSLQDCLGTVKAWSDANPSHVPIAILVELKDDIIDTGSLTFTHPDPWNATSMDRLDAEIRNVFPPDDLITPDDVRGTHATLEEAVTTDGWPTLAASRGKVMFLMDNGNHYRTDYLAGHPSLKGRILFTNANPGDADAAFVERNDSKNPEIPDLIKKGYVVRTRSDEPDGAATTGDRSELNAALASGAQWISTDYPVAGYSDGLGTGYVAEIPGGTVARCNPVNGPDGCDSATLDTVFTPTDRPAGIKPVAAAPTTTTAPTTVPSEPTTPTPVPPGTTPPAVAVDAPARFTG